MQSEDDPKIQINPEKDNINSLNENYIQPSLKHSNVMSVVSHISTIQNLIQYFENYICFNCKFNLQELRTSEKLKIKKYKQCVYYGELEEGKKSGKGIMVYNSGRIYEGSWQKDLKHFYGFEKFPNDCIYEGNYENGKPNGVGKYIWFNGEFYEGEWKNGLKHGSGMWKGLKGDSYIGEWINGSLHGYGVQIWINGDRYEGNFKENLKHGQGVQRFKNGDIYKGCYEKGKHQGFGQYYWSNGTYYKGMFKEGLRQGQGIWKRKAGNSDKYEGEYTKDKKHGYGIYSWENGNIYKGNYSQDMREGYGQMHWNDGSFYKGKWKKGVQDGLGQIYILGQGFKKGLFKNNVLIHVDSESSSLPSTEQGQSQQFGRSQKNKKNKLNITADIQYQKVHSNQHSQVVVYAIQDIKKFSLMQKYFPRPVQINSQNKYRALHSAFHLHKMHNILLKQKKFHKDRHVSVMTKRNGIGGYPKTVKLGRQYLVRDEGKFMKKS